MCWCYYFCIFGNQIHGMNILISPSNNPFFNLALEEYLFKKSDEDLFILYINEPSVICGKHQIPYKELNVPYVEVNNILICRRFSGGGTVYHDKGNLNFCYITKHSKKSIEIDFKKYIKPIYEFLVLMGLSASINERNNILIEGKKISGNAEHILKNRTLHHGTLLFDTDLCRLNKSLESNYSCYNDKSVKSVHASVTNILPFLSKPINIQIFRNYLVDFMLRKHDCDFFELNDEDTMSVFRLSMEKYAKPEWLYGYSPVYTVNKTVHHNNIKVEFSIHVEKGKVKSFQVENDIRDYYSQFLSGTVGTSHTTENFGKIFEMYNQSNPLRKNFVNVYSFF